MVLILMIVSIISYIMCWIYFGYYSKKYNQWTKEYEKRDKVTVKVCATSGITFISTFVIGIIYLIVLCTVSSNGEYSDYSIYNEKSIVALEDNSDVEGRMYYRSGYIEENLYYYYMELLPNGGKQMGKIEAEETTIFENSEKYKIEFYKSIRKTKDYLFLGIMDITEERYRTYLYVPKDTVTTDYNIDMK